MRDRGRRSAPPVSRGRGVGRRREVDQARWRDSEQQGIVEIRSVEQVRLVVVRPVVVAFGIANLGGVAGLELIGQSQEDLADGEDRVIGQGWPEEWLQGGIGLRHGGAPSGSTWQG
ncbi:hypothetical protein CKO09_12915, partial [Chromatium weissei]|nr:hypothetical protein [Chromatium weissei]